MSVIDLSHIRAIDNHCHPVLRSIPEGVTPWRQIFSEASDEDMRVRHVPATAFYQRLLGEMARFHGCDASETSVIAARSAAAFSSSLSRMGQEAAFDHLLIDTGYPRGENVLPNADLARGFGCRYSEILRLELLFQDLVCDHPTLDRVRESLRERLRDVRSSGYAGLKSIVGYRTGLQVDRWDEGDARQAFDLARRQVAEAGRVRLGYKALLDTLLLDALTEASRQELPVQFHVGYGDPDVDLRTANPLQLRPLITDSELAGVQFVLLHGCWPYFREGAFLATVYPNVWLDLSYAIPFFGTSEYREVTRVALSTAPWSKILFSTDAGHVPELHWMGAIEGRKSISRVLTQLVADGDLPADQAMIAAVAILRDNAAGLYGLRRAGE